MIPEKLQRTTESVFAKMGQDTLSYPWDGPVGALRQPDPGGEGGESYSCHHLQTGLSFTLGASCRRTLVGAQ